jgi:hypothetical protein
MMERVLAIGSRAQLTDQLRFSLQISQSSLSWTQGFLMDNQAIGNTNNARYR